MTAKTRVGLLVLAALVAVGYGWFLHAHRNQLNVDPHAREVIERARRR